MLNIAKEKRVKKLAMILYTKAILEKVIKPNNDNIYCLSVHPGAV
jgi:hypothetical protein